MWEQVFQLDFWLRWSALISGRVSALFECRPFIAMARVTGVSTEPQMCSVQLGGGCSKHGDESKTGNSLVREENYAFQSCLEVVVKVPVRMVITIETVKKTAGPEAWSPLQSFHAG